MVGLFSKDSEVVEEKVKVVKAKRKGVDSKELLGWGWQVLAVEIGNLIEIVNLSEIYIGRCLFSLESPLPSLRFSALSPCFN